MFIWTFWCVWMKKRVLLFCSNNDTIFLGCSEDCWIRQPSKGDHRQWNLGRTSSTVRGRWMVLVRDPISCSGVTDADVGGGCGWAEPSQAQTIRGRTTQTDSSCEQLQEGWVIPDVIKWHDEIVLLQFIRDQLTSSSSNPSYLRQLDLNENKLLHPAIYIQTTNCQVWLNSGDVLNVYSCQIDVFCV